MHHTPGYPAISDYALIGNCHTAALISSRGSIDWLCMPRFDSPSIFARILDLDKGGAWMIAPEAEFQAQHRYVDDTNVLETIFSTDTGRLRVRDFMPLTLSDYDHHPAGAAYAVIRVVESIEGDIPVVSLCAPRPDYARQAVDLAIDGSRATFDRFVLNGPAEWQIDETQHALRCMLTITPDTPAVFMLRLADVQPIDNPMAALDATIEFWQGWAARCTYEGPYRAAVIRSALALKLMTDEPSGAIVAAPTTSLPEEIGGERNWDYRFTWIRDASFTLYALLLAGYHDSDDPFFNWIVRTVKLKGTGISILHPISGEGRVHEEVLAHLEGYRQSAPVRIGNAASSQLQLDVYGEVLDALHFAWQVGDFDPASVWDHFRPLIDWVVENWSRPDSGIWEIRGGQRHFVYSKVMCWVALDRGIDMARGCGLDGDIEGWSRTRDAIRQDVLEHGWSERIGAFTQSYEDELLDASNLLLPVVGFIDGDDPRMIATIDATIDRLVVDDLCYRYLGAPDGVAGSEATFVLCTFWLIDALILAGREAEAQRLFERTLERATALGLFAEQIDPTSGEQLGNFPQAFSHIGVINAAVSLAHAGTIGTVHPRLQRSVSGCKTGVGQRRGRPVPQRVPPDEPITS